MDYSSGNGTIRDMMSRKVREWLIKIGGGVDNGAQTKASKITGLSQGYISKIINSEDGVSIGIGTLQDIATRMGCETWRLVWAIETGSLFPPKEPDVRLNHENS